MFVAILITVGYIVAIWLVFFKYKLMRFSMAWGIVTFWVGIHLLLIFLIGLRFFQPYTIDSHIVRHTIQLVPRLPEPTLLTEVLVEANTQVKKGQPLFRFDQSIYLAKLRQAEAQLADAKQNVLILQADVDAAQEGVALATANLTFAQEQKSRYEKLAKQGAARGEQLDRWTDEVDSRTAQLKQAEANLTKAQLASGSQIDGVNTSVAEAESSVTQAKYFLEQTTIYAPEDGFITNLQARPGLVTGILRVGAIASLIADSDPYLLASYYQEHMKFVAPGQPVEIALDLYPGEIFTGTVENIWWATGQGQYLPSGRIPNFVFPKPQGRFAVQIKFDDDVAVNLPAGAHGAVAIYTGQGKPFAVLRRIGIRFYTFANFIYPFPV